MSAITVATEVANRMRTADAAAYLGLSVSTLDKHRSSGTGPRYLKLGGRVFYRRADLDAYLQSAVVETTDSRSAA